MGVRMIAASLIHAVFVHLASMGGDADIEYADD
jgi:hypothetical protein